LFRYGICSYLIKTEALRLITLIFLVLFSFLSAQAQETEWQWVRGFGGVSFDHGQDLAVDFNGNIFLTGTFQETVILSTDTLVSKGQHDVFLAKFNPEGDLLWCRQAGGTAKDQSLGIAVNSRGEAIITGMFEGWMYFESDTLKSIDNSDIFVANYSPTGQLNWVRREGGMGFDGGYDIACDPNNNVYLMGTYTYIEPGAKVKAREVYKGNQVFMAKYKPNGDLDWVKPTRGAGKIFGHAITVDDQENVYIACQYSGQVIFSRDTLPGNGGIALAKYNKQGQISWLHDFGADTLTGFGAELCLTDQGNLLMTGAHAKLKPQSAENEKQTTGISNTSPGNSHFDVFLTSINPKNGHQNWWYSAGGLDMDKGMGVWTQDTLIMMTGWLSQTARFSDTEVKAFGGNNMYLATFNIKGKLLNVFNPLQRGLGYGKAIRGDKKGNFYWTGWHTGMLNMPTELLFSKGKADIFIGKFNWNANSE